ncbi:hypothetical protein BC332_18340 [Capsicum chinense]|nr:hypothetical protein BC332_18340 [Capsicum chinense]
MRDHAIHCGFQSYLDLPVFESIEKNCVGVIELVTVWKGGYLTYEVERVLNPLEMDFKKTHYSVGEAKNDFQSEFAYRFNHFDPHSDPSSSPVESVVGSTENVSDEDDFITRKMGYSTMQDNTTKGLNLSGSPQSTLCGCRHESTLVCPNG